MPSAEDFYREAIDWLDDSPTIQHARARLVFGEWLRRQKRRTEAREHLRVAHDIFSVMGANAFVARVERRAAPRPASGPADGATTPPPI